VHVPTRGLDAYGALQASPPNLDPTDPIDDTNDTDKSDPT
jgi:hypothetical protein